MMESEFQMSTMEELTFFLGIQVKQMKQGTFVDQAEYMKDLMNRGHGQPKSSLELGLAAALGHDSLLQEGENGEGDTTQLGNCSLELGRR
jgi:hypothetical protein